MATQSLQDALHCVELNSLLGGIKAHVHRAHAQAQKTRSKNERGSFMTKIRQENESISQEGTIDLNGGYFPTKKFKCGRPDGDRFSWHNLRKEQFFLQGGTSGKGA
ncbi:hypothetical protein V3C99_015189 [Haemonchus contortus]